jgi:site-specific recombinase XerD
METATELSHITTLAQSWELHLRAERKSPATIANYTSAVERLTDHLNAHGMPTDVTKLTREHVEAFIVSLVDTRSPATAVNRYKALQQYFRWLDDEGEIANSPMVKMSPPALDEVEVPVVSLENLRKLLDACKGTGFDDRRDTALIRLMFDSGARLAEVAGLEVADLDLRGYEVAHVRGMGGKHRALPMGPKTLKSVDTYLRKRASHKDAESPFLWLGVKGRLTGSGIRQALKRRCREAGIPEIHPHQLRHSFAHQFLASGGQETDLMQLAGWSSRKMVGRYAASVGAERAREAHRRLSPGESL